jgi:hypothetical protein
VVLSACNTGAGAGAGAEAASGLGRAFFYAGPRAILADLFRRQAAEANLPRGEALRRTTIAVMDSKGFLPTTRATPSLRTPIRWGHQFLRRWRMHRPVCCTHRPTFQTSWLASRPRSDRASHIQEAGPTEQEDSSRTDASLSSQ